MTGSDRLPMMMCRLPDLRMMTVEEEEEERAQQLRKVNL
jgi:hypothetical protein